MRPRVTDSLTTLLSILLLGTVPLLADESIGGPDTSQDTLRSALQLADEAALGLVLTPDLLESVQVKQRRASQRTDREPLQKNSVEPGAASIASGSSTVDGDESTKRVLSQISYEEPTTGDPRRIDFQGSQLSVVRSRFRSTLQASADALVAGRLDDEIVIFGEKLGTGLHSGIRGRLGYVADSPDGLINAGNVIAMGLEGEDRLEADPFSFYLLFPYDYKSTFLSVEANAIRRTEYKRRVRQQFVGLRYIDQSDSIETAGFNFYDPTVSSQEARNRMLGVQVGIDQAWHSRSRLRFGWGVKGGVYYGRATQEGYAYNGSAGTLPLMLDYHADAGFRIFDQAYLELGIVGLRLEDQYQTRYAWEDPTSTHRVSLLGMRLGLDYTY